MRRIRRSGVTRPHWKAECGESRTLRLEWGKGCKALPITTLLLLGRNTVSPICFPSASSGRSTVRKADGRRVEERGESECHLVMRWIGVEPQGNIILTGNGANFHEVSRHERICRIFLKGGNANERLLVCAPSGPGSETANPYREGIQRMGTGSCERGLR